MSEQLKYGSAADVAKRIREWLGPNGRQNTASLLLYEAMQALEAQARVALAQAGEALFWYRPRSDDGYEGPIHNDAIERVRKQSGGWVPLYPGAAPAPDAAPAPASPAALTVIREKLARFNECAEDDEDCDIGRDWLDALTTIGLLARVNRSPARWEMTDTGAALLTAKLSKDAPLTDEQILNIARGLPMQPWGIGSRSADLIPFARALLAAQPAARYEALEREHLGDIDKKTGIYSAEDARASRQGVAMSKDAIREVFLAHGFTVKEGQSDLKQYVYDAAEALLARASGQDSVPEFVRNGDLEAALWRWAQGHEMDSQATGYRMELYRWRTTSRQQGALSEDFTRNTLNSIANWFESRSETVWAKEFSHAGLMLTWANDLRAILSRASSPRADMSNDAGKIDTSAERVDSAYTSPRASDEPSKIGFSCAKRAADPSNEFAACRQWCGDTGNCPSTIGHKPRREFDVKLFHRHVDNLSDMTEEERDMAPSLGPDKLTPELLAAIYAVNKTETRVRHRASSPRAEAQAVPNPDDIAVDRFAAAMKTKMAVSRAKGRSGWDNPDCCTPDDLASMLIDHLYKGDPVDVGNFAMMLFNRPDATDALAKAAPHAQCRDIAGALFDFGGYLTSREERITVSASDLATPMVEALRAWAVKRGLQLDHADVMHWNAPLAAAEAPNEGKQDA